jgi:hypothetical protein
VSNLAGLPALGQKQPSIKKARRKAIRRLSKKRAAYLASPERALGVAHMGRVAQMRCIACGAYGVEVHHATIPHDDFKVLPLCPPHHRREFGPGAIHYSPRAFAAKHGDVKFLLAKVADILAGQFNDEGAW